MSDVSAVTNHFSTANEGFVTTLGSTISSGASTVPLNTTSGLTNGSIFVGIIEPGTVGKQQTFTGTVDTGGSQITGVVWTRGANTTHAAGVTIVDYVSGTGHNMITKGITNFANQNGTLKSAAVDAAIAAGSIDTAQLADGAVTPAKLLAGTGTSWPWQTWTPTWTNLTVGNGTVVAKYVQVGKTIHFELHLTLGSTTSISGNVIASLPATAVSYPASSAVGVGSVFDVSATTTFPAHVTLQSTTTLAPLIYTATATYADYRFLTATVPFTFANTDIIQASGTYEAA